MLRPFFEWCDTTTIGIAIRSSTWGFPLIETFHIWALAVLLGSLFLIDSRLLGLRWGGFTAFRLNRELGKYMNVSMATILVTGVLLFLSDPIKCYDNSAFWPKMYFLGGALVFHFTGHHWVVKREQPPAWGKLAGLLSLGLWFAVGAAGRAIGFV